MVVRLQADRLQDSVVLRRGIQLDIIVHETIESTNTWSLHQCKQGKALPFACFAEEQTSGRGRRGKSWVMSPRGNIAMSLCWPFEVSHQQLHLLPLSIALAIVKTLESIHLQHVQIKWPNDVYVQGKKIAGVLIETRMIQSVLSGDVAHSSSELRECVKKDSRMAVVIGVGLNYDMASTDVKSESGAAGMTFDITDIQRELALQNTEDLIDREMVASMLLQNVIDICQDFQQDAKQNLDEFRTKYDYCKNKQVDILLDDQQVLPGVAQGVSEVAELIVMIDGKQRTFNSAEVSVKIDNA
jgi:BirA family biotin operon repressor/biotin-[acetyl-CoA-carboxylase] ligase